MIFYVTVSYDLRFYISSLRLLLLWFGSVLGSGLSAFVFSFPLDLLYEVAVVAAVAVVG